MAVPAKIHRQTPTVYRDPRSYSRHEVSLFADYCETLRRQDSDALGFIPAIAYQQAIEAGKIIFEVENDEPCGYVFGNRRKRLLRVYQCVIQKDARRILHASRLIARVIAADHHKGATHLALRVATDLPANHFWQSIGCKVISVQPGGKSRKRMINVYRRRIGDKMEIAESLIHANVRYLRRGLDKIQSVGK